MVRRSGTYVEDSFDGAGSGRAFPLSIGTIYNQQGEAVVGEAGVVRPERSEIQPRRRREHQQRGHEDADNLLKRAGLDPRSTERFYRLDDQGTYVVVFQEAPAIPEEGMGLVRPADNLRNAGIVMNASFIEADDSVIEATLLVVDKFTLLAEDATIAELAVVPSASRT